MRGIFRFGVWAFALLPSAAPAALSLRPSRARRRRPHARTRAAFLATSVFGFGAALRAPALASAKAASPSSGVVCDASAPSAETIVYSPLSVDVNGVEVPVAAWHPRIDGGESVQTAGGNVSYEHRISISKISKQLVGWNLPAFLNRNFSLEPSSSISGNVRVIASSSTDRQRLPRSAPVVLLAHGYLGSRFDLSHLGEALASRGFLVLAPEYPESLAASYDPTGGTDGATVDRTTITDALLKTLEAKAGWDVRPTSRGIVGHSLGCGTVDRTGDASWTRVCLAGGAPSLRGPNCLFVGSVNDGAVGVGRAEDAVRGSDFVRLDEGEARSRRSWDDAKLPPRCYLIFRDPDAAPNHISFLSEGTNDAMVSFLSPLLPVARALGVPVLDFDKYQASRDSAATGDAVIPLVVGYLKQMMNV